MTAHRPEQPSSPRPGHAAASAEGWYRDPYATHQETYGNERARQAAFDAISGGAVVDDPGGNW